MSIDNAQCCGVTIKSGTIIVGILNTVLDVYILTLLVAMLTRENVDLEYNHVDTYRQLPKGIMISVAMIPVLQGIFSLLLVIGTMAECAKLLIPWLVVYTTELVFYSLIIIGKLITNERKSTENLYMILKVVVACCIKYIILRIVQVEYKYLKIISNDKFKIKPTIFVEDDSGKVIEITHYK